MRRRPRPRRLAISKYDVARIENALKIGLRMTLIVVIAKLGIPLSTMRMLYRRI